MTRSADEVGEDAARPDATQGLERWRGFVERHRARLHWAGVAFSLAILALSVFVLARTLASLSWSEFRVALAATGWDQIALSGLFTALSFLFLTGYDALALRQLKLTVPYGRTALASFTSFAIAFTLGFPLVTGGTVRYWIYSQSGLSAGKVASLTLISGFTFWLGLALIVGCAFAFSPAAMGAVDHLGAPINVLVGVGTLCAIAAYLVWVARGRRRIKARGLRLELPGLPLTLGQMAVGVCDLAAAAAALYALLPRGYGGDYIHFVATYALGCLLGVASNAPGGVGAFEMTLLKATPAASQESMLASLLLFRVIYYVGPFVLALALIGAHEALRRWTSLRAEMSTPGTEDEP